MPDKEQTSSWATQSMLVISEEKVSCKARMTWVTKDKINQTLIFKTPTDLAQGCVSCSFTIEAHQWT